MTRDQISAELQEFIDAVAACNGGRCWNGPVDPGHYDGPWTTHTERLTALGEAIGNLVDFLSRNLASISSADLKQVTEMPATYVWMPRDDSNDVHDQEPVDSSRPRQMAADELRRRGEPVLAKE